MNIKVIFTCHNRREKTVKCIESLLTGNPQHSVTFIVLDDNSNDGTKKAIKMIDSSIEVISGDGNLFWSGGMQAAIDYFLKSRMQTDYVLLVNDDVNFRPNIIECLINRSRSNHDAVVVGATCDDQGEFSYGALKLNKSRKRKLYEPVEPGKQVVECDSFNCNCVLIKNEIIRRIGNFDPIYRHSLADLDYGFTLKRSGYQIISSEDYVGICNKNSKVGTWQDCSLGRLERIKKKESVKGAPTRE